MTQKVERRPATNGAASRNYEAGEPSTTVPPTDDNLPRGRAVAYPPARGRTLWLIVARRCPWCTSGHSHRSGLTARLLSGRVAKVCPVWNRGYILAPVQRGREAVRPVGVIG